MFRPSFLSGLLALISAPAAFAQLAPLPLVDHGDSWKCRKGTSAPAVGWASVADAALDASWSAGPGGFGYADGDDATREFARDVAVDLRVELAGIADQQKQAIGEVGQ